MRPGAVRGANTAQRWLAGAGAAGILALLATAAWLKPSPLGAGTHEQLGLHPCGWALMLGKPCPTCGMTTAFAHAADVHLFDSFLAQPMGMLLALFCSALFWALLHVAFTGSRVVWFLSLYIRARVLWIVFAALMAAWVYKMATWSGHGGLLQ